MARFEEVGANTAITCYIVKCIYLSWDCVCYIELAQVYDVVSPLASRARRDGM
jgi:hypothetical protein